MRRDRYLAICGNGDRVTIFNGLAIEGTSAGVPCLRNNSCIEGCVSELVDPLVDQEGDRAYGFQSHASHGVWSSIDGSRGSGCTDPRHYAHQRPVYTEFGTTHLADLVLEAGMDEAYFASLIDAGVIGEDSLHV